MSGRSLLSLTLEHPEIKNKSQLFRELYIGHKERNQVQLSTASKVNSSLSSASDTHVFDLDACVHTGGRALLHI